nr:hypothetical protein [Brevibacillus laterosporus]
MNRNEVLQWLVEWLSDQEIVLYHNGFSTIGFAIKKEKALPIKGLSVIKEPFLRLQRIDGLPDQMLVSAGMLMMDLSFQGNQRLYLLDIKRKRPLYQGWMLHC